MINLGTVRPGSTILVPFHVFDSNDPSSSVAASAFVLADIGIYKGTSMTERLSTTGVVLLDTDGIDLDAAVGIHGFSIDLSSNATAGFYASGSHYYVTVGPITVDGATVVNFIAATFTIGYPDAIINTTVASVTSQTQFILTDGPAEADALIGCSILFHDVASAVQIAYGYITDYIVTTKEVICTDPVGFVFVATDNVSIFMPSNVHAVQGTTQTAGDIPALVVTADAAIDVAVADLANATDGLGALKTLIDTVNTDLANGTDGLGALKTLIDTVNTDLSNGTDGLGALKTLIDALNDISTADVNAQVVDVLKTDTVTLPGQTAPPLAPTFEQMISWLYKVLRNRTRQTATLWELLADDETTVDAKVTVSDDTTTAIKQEIVSGP